MIRQFKVIVEKHSDGYVAYPFGLKGVVVGEGNRSPHLITPHPDLPPRMVGEGRVRGLLSVKFYRDLTPPST